ncbi:MAG: hypothetical protein KKH22_12095 [Proteobacteria bacterium]|nr:hypothetical protein [Pseudomonadota bacterium]
MSLAEISRKFIGMPYRLGVVDCFSSILLYMEERGATIPAEFMGVSRADYAAMFQSNPEEAKALMVRFMDSMFPSVEPPFAFAGDILLLRLVRSDKPAFLGIDGGNGNIIAAAESRGICVLHLKNYTIERAWRCRQHSL